MKKNEKSNETSSLPNKKRPVESSGKSNIFAIK